MTSSFSITAHKGDFNFNLKAPFPVFFVRGKIPGMSVFFSFGLDVDDFKGKKGETPHFLGNQSPLSLQQDNRRDFTSCGRFEDIPNSQYPTSVGYYITAQINLVLYHVQSSTKAVSEKAISLEYLC